MKEEIHGKQAVLQRKEIELENGFRYHIYKVGGKYTVFRGSWVMPLNEFLKEISKHENEAIEQVGSDTLDQLEKQEVTDNI